MKAKSGSPISRFGLRAIVVAGLFTAATCGLFAQSANPPRFAVASIKRDASTEPLTMASAMGVGYRPGGRLVAHNAPVTMLIQRAYSLQSWQLVGGPAWVSQEGYDIEAKPESNTDQKQMWLMLQTLLAERFKLSMHQEKRDLPVYDLVATKGGPKLAPPDPGYCSEVLTTLPQPGEERPAQPCGPGVTGSPTGLTLEGVRIAMPALAKQLSMLLGREVVDKTGYAGQFSIHMEFAMDEALAGIPNPPPLPATDQPGDRPPTITTALQQLGLKIQPSKGPVEVNVIDHVERPTAN